MIDTMQIPVEARQKYLDRRKQDVASCQEAISNQDFNFLERMGHQIKGNAATFGFDELTDIAIAVEQAAKVKNLALLKELVVKFSTVVQSARL